MTIETKAHNTADFTPNSAIASGVTTVAEAIAARNAALEAEFSAKSVHSVANDSLRELTEAHESAVAERETADFLCASVQNFYRRMEHLVGRKDSLQGEVTRTRLAMLAGTDEIAVLDATGHMMQAEEALEKVIAEAAQECARICEAVGVENDMTPNPFWNWRNRAAGKAAGERRNAAVKAVGALKEQLQAARVEFDRTGADHHAAWLRLQEAYRVLEAVARSRVTELNANEVGQSDQ
jgi:hypothetical protein